MPIANTWKDEMSIVFVVGAREPELAALYALDLGADDPGFVCVAEFELSSLTRQSLLEALLCVVDKALEGERLVSSW